MKLVTLFLVIIILHHLTITIALGSAYHLGNETDRVALLAIKSQLVDPPGGVLSSWNHSLHHCFWEGVICGHKHNRVVELELYSRGLTGTISPFIGNLSFLHEIVLFNNSLYGQIPSEISKLFRLRRLGLYNNTFDGEIPPNLSNCSDLRVISLGFNKLEGRLPKGLGALSKLTVLAVHFNNFSGPLFHVIANLTTLEVISATQNLFTGTIPNIIGRMQNLNFLSAGENHFSGILPTSIFNLSSLQILAFSESHLEGELPADIALTLPLLKTLNIARNKFSGSIPISISNLTSLEVIALGGNNFTGRVPHDFGRLHNLDHLLLHDNYLTGDVNFIDSLINCTKMETLELNDNYFTGTLPKSIANLSTSLTWLTIGDSPITGEIPPGITNLINLVQLTMTDSEITGSIPHDLGKLPKLQKLVLSSNGLTGNIPNSLGNLSQLSWLTLYDNKLQGIIPSSLGSCQNLLYLYLHGNDLNGTLGKELFGGSPKFIELYLSNNLLEGFLPLEITEQKNLVTLDVSRNNLSGVLPDGLGDCSGLQYLDISGNSFYGFIPPSLTLLGSLQVIDLSHNNLSGPIPAYFSKFPLLSYLNLSYNNFEGRVPTNGVFANASAISLNGNNGLCGGIKELLLPRCVDKVIGSRKKRKVSSALKVIIPIICALVGVLATATALYLSCIRKKRGSASSGSLIGEVYMQLSYNMLLKATNEFSSANLLGTGAFGSVFKANLDEKTFAVKVFNLQHCGASKSFMAECKALRNVRHRNLVGIVTACSSIDFQGNDFKALVYEFMPHGSLDRWLHEVGNLTLLQRVGIAIDVAHALNYLHHEGEIPIAHCDLKPSNILLDNDMVAHVGDFGLTKILAQPQHLNQSSSIGIRGTVGYAAPEYGLGGEVAPSGDLYSYGILLLELMTGKRPTDNMFKEDLSLHVYAETALPDHVLQIIDPTLEDNEIPEDVDDTRAIQTMVQRRLECIVSIFSVGVACSNHLPHDRMRITDAINMLRVARDNLFNAITKVNCQRGA